MARRVGVLLLLVLVLAARARADEPSRRWYTIRTPHFRVHFYESSRHSEAQIAQKVAAAAEQAHAVLTPAFGHVPDRPTHIVVTDDTDSANGSATIIPYNLIRIFVSAPSSQSSLADYDDWIFTLLVHEYAHILHIDTIHGLPRLVNAVMGKIWAPNQIQPRWFIEGVAVFHESRHTSGGRNRATIYDMMLRTAVLEGKLLELDQISSSTRYYPRGVVPYLYGGRFLAFIAERYGEAALRRISHRYAAGFVPYAINRTVSEVTGKSYEQLYDDFRQYLKRRYQAQQQAVRQRGPTPFRALTDHGWTVASPRFASSGAELVYIDDDGRHRPAIRIINPQTGRRIAGYRHFGGEGVAFDPSGRYLVYPQRVAWRTFHDYHDLYLRDRESGKVRRLTDGLRAREPDVSPDGLRVAFVHNELGRSSIYLARVDGAAPRQLIPAREGEQYFTPRFSPDGRTLSFSHQRPGGRRDIGLYDLATGQISHLTNDRALDMDPVFSADGRRIYFSSDRSGIFNVYCFDRASGGLQQVTNVIGGAFAPAVSPDEKTLVYVGFSSRGYDLHSMCLDPRRWLPALPYSDSRPAPRLAKAPAWSYPVAPYNPLHTVYPRSWSFDLGSNAFGALLGIEIDGADAIARHSYSARLESSFEREAFSYNLAYAYRRFWPSMQLSTNRVLRQRGDLVIDGQRRSYLEESYGFSARLGLPVLRMPGYSVNLGVGYAVSWLRNGQGGPVVVLPDQISPALPEAGRVAGLSFSVGYDAVERFAESISAERGRRLSLDLRVDNALLGSQLQTTQLGWSWTEFVSLPWLDQHVLGLRYAGGIARGELERRGYFFLGGFPRQDLVRAVIELAPLGGAYLRGYDPGTFSGDQYHLLNVEYRFPLLQLEKGLSTLPVYLTHLHVALFCDTGAAFFGELEDEHLKTGVGTELLSEWVVGYFAGLTLRLGYARGLMARGAHEVFALIGNRF